MSPQQSLELHRFAEFGKLSSGIFHDLLNPLTTVLLTVEHIQNQGELKNPESILHIKQAVRASKRIKDFIHTAQKQLDVTGVQKIFSLEHEVRDAIDLLSYKSHKMGVEIITKLNQTTLIYGNSVKFFQICVNLISNAIDSYSDHSNNAPKHIIVLVDTDESDIRLSIQDFGKGIAPHLHQKIFEPFYTTKPKHQGLGIGLSATRNAIEQDFAGRMELESSLGRGSTFTVCIPLKLKASDRRRSRRQITKPASSCES